MIRVAGPEDADAVARLRVAWSGGEEPGFAARVAAWIEAEGDRRTTWLAEEGGEALGMASLFEYRRMPKAGAPDERWGWVANMFVRADARGRGLGASLLGALVAAADERSYVRLALAPSERAVSLYRRAGFVDPGPELGDDRVLVRPG